MKTPQGKYLIFDVTEFLPGRPIPHQFCEEANTRGPFFFHPAHWTLENYWGGNAVAYIIGQEKCWPMMYSIGFPTAEEALSAATEWEIKEPQRHAFQQAVQQEMDKL